MFTALLPVLIKSKGVSILGFLASKRLALSLLLTLTGIALLGAIVPQETGQHEALFTGWLNKYPTLGPILVSLGITRIFSTNYFYLVVVLFFLNTLACTYAQVARLSRHSKQDVKEERFTGNWSTFLTADEVLNLAEQILRKRSFRVVPLAETKGIKGLKGQPGLWGSIIFHGGLVFLLAGVVFSVNYRLEGYKFLTEGQVFVEQHNAYSQLKEGPWFREKHIGKMFRLEEMKIIYNQDISREEFINKFSVFDQEGDFLETQEVTVSQPLQYQGYSFYFDKQGYTPLLSIFDRNGVLVRNLYTMLDTTKDGDKWYFRRTMMLEESRVQVRLDFFPDVGKGTQGFISKSYILNNPGLVITQNPGQAEAKQALLKIGESVKIGEFVYSFGDIKRYSGYRIVFDGGVWLVYLSFLIIIAGGALIYIFVPRSIQVEVREDQGRVLVMVRGQTRNYFDLFGEEFAEITGLLLGETGEVTGE